MILVGVARAAGAAAAAGPGPIVRSRWLVVSVLCLMGSASIADAQSRALIALAHGGGFFPLTKLASGGDDFSFGVSVGGALGLQISPNVALRGSATYVRTNYRGATLTLTDVAFTRLFYAADVQIGWPTESGFAPYLLGGAGAVRVDPRDSGIASFTKLGVRFGSGLNHVSGFGVIFLEASGWVYRFNQLGFDRTQVELLLHFGVAFAVPF